VSATRRRKPPARPARRRRTAPVRDFWGHDTNEEPAPERIRPSEDPAALIQSLGPPPLPGGEAVAEHYFAATYQKAASLAIALAAASDLLDLDEDDV